MKTHYFIVAIVLAMAPHAACQVGTTLTPVAPDGHLEMGREYILLSNGGLQVELGFDGIYEKNLVFDFVVVNNRDLPVSLDPEQFYYELLDSAEAESALDEPRYSVAPDKIFDFYDDALELRKVEKGINTFLGFLETGIGFISDATAYLDTENPAFILDAIFHTAGTAGHYVHVDRTISREMEQITLEKEVVKDEVFRSGELPPGKVASGLLFFPMQKGDVCYMFCFPLDNQLFQFVYNQRSGPAQKK